MRKLQRIAVLLAAVLILAVMQLQLQHVARFGHFIPLGLHADVFVRNGDFGIDGITKTYEAKLTNYGIWPARVTVCDFVDDAFSHGTVIRYVVEKYELSAGKWDDTRQSDAPTFCHPYPLGMAQTHLVAKRLWPGQSVSTGPEATAARDVFAIGDKARFVVFAGQERAFATAPFSIDQHPAESNVPYRIRH